MHVHWVFVTKYHRNVFTKEVLDDPKKELPIDQEKNSGVERSGRPVILWEVATVRQLKLSGSILEQQQTPV